MHRHRRIMTREMGTAFAVLAIYVLTLLMPLHQAAGLQRDFNALGYATLDSWSVCASLAQDSKGEPADAAALTCPVTGTAKQQLAAVLPPVLAIEPPSHAEIIRFTEASGTALPGLPRHIGQSRAPPATV